MTFWYHTPSLSKKHMFVLLRQCMYIHMYVKEMARKFSSLKLKPLAYVYRLWFDI